MRCLCACTLVCCMVVLACASSTFAVGLYTPGQEPCKPGSIGSTGKVPDVLNQLTEAFVFPSVFRALDKFAGEIKAILGQFGVKTSKHLPLKEVKPQAKASVQKSLKPRRIKKIKRPARAM